MGYDLHITRREKWYDKDDLNVITLDEWVNYVKADKELKFEGNSDNPVDWDAIWVADPKGIKPPFRYFDGRIIMKNPDEHIIAKMIAIAKALNAKVQGDEDEIYDETYLAKQAGKPWWKFW